MGVIIGVDPASPDGDKAVVAWREGRSHVGFCDLPKRGERFVRFPGRSGMCAYGCVEWRKAKRWIRTGRVERVREFWLS